MKKHQNKNLAILNALGVPATDSPVRAYLKEFLNQLVVMPENDKREACREVLQHIEQMIERKRLEGFSEMDALARALRDFGDPVQIGQGTMLAWMRRFGRTAGERVTQTSKRLRLMMVASSALTGLCIFLLTAQTSRHWLDPIFLRCEILFIAAFSLSMHLESRWEKEVRLPKIRITAWVRAQMYFLLLGGLMARPTAGGGQRLAYFIRLARMADPFWGWPGLSLVFTFGIGLALHMAFGRPLWLKVTQALLLCLSLAFIEWSRRRSPVA